MVFVYRNYVIPLSALENHVFSLFGPYLALIWLFQVNRDESLTFGQTSQLRLEMRLICSNYIYNYITLLLALENHVSSLCGPYSALIRPSFGQLPKV